MVETRRPVEGEVRVRVGAIGLSALGTQIAGTVDAVGPDSVGFARGDRVAFAGRKAPAKPLVMVEDRGLIGVPADVSLDAAAAIFPSALLARAVVKQVHPVGRGTRIRILDVSALAPFVRAWAQHLGAVIVPADAPADVTVDSRSIRAARAWRSGHGLAQQAAADVFAAIRAGAFDGIALSTPKQAREGSRSPVLLHPAEVSLAA